MNVISRMVVIDCYLSHNFGDDLFLLTLVKRYPHVRFIITADNTYEYLTKRFNNIELHLEELAKHDSSVVVRLLRHCKKINERLQLIRSADAFITIGGSLYMESVPEKTLNTVVNEKRRFLRDKLFARAAHHYFILGANFGPYYSESYRRFYEDFFHKYCDDVCFRDKYSAGLFQSIDSVRYAPDVLFNTVLPPVNKEKKIFISAVDLNQTGKFGILKEKAEAYDRLILRYMTKYCKLGYDIVLCSFSKPEGDEIAVERLSKLAEKSGIGIRTLRYSNNTEVILGELASAEIVIGTRFHATILGLLAGAQVLPLIYSDKTEHVLEDMHFDLSCAIDLQKNDWTDMHNEVLPHPLSFDATALKVQSEQQFSALDNFLLNSR